jgi:hypothetical protein
VDAVQKRLAANIRARAKSLGMPLSHIPDRAGVGRANFWVVLRGETSPTLGWLVKIAKSLECDVADLLSKTGK